VRAVSASGSDTVNDCHVSLTCDAASLAANRAVVAVVDTTPDAFAIGFEWSLSSLDYFGQPSTVGGTISAQLGHMFKVSSSAPTLDDPAGWTMASATATSASYTDESLGMRRGVLLQLGGQVAGGQVTPGEFSTAPHGVAFVLNLDAFPATLAVTITQKMSTISIVAQSIAILSGVAGLGRVLMLVLQQLCYSDVARVRMSLDVDGYAQLPMV